MDEEVVEEEEADAMTGRCTTVLTSCQDEASEKLGFAELLSSQKKLSLRLLARFPVHTVLSFLPAGAARSCVKLGAWRGKYDQQPCGSVLIPRFTELVRRVKAPVRARTALQA